MGKHLNGPRCRRGRGKSGARSQWKRGFPGATAPAPPNQKAMQATTAPVAMLKKNKAVEINLNNIFLL